MRFIVFGVGAVGGTIAAALTRAGYPVIGIARGAMLEALQRSGLLFRTPRGDERLHFPVVATPAEIDFEPDDIVILTMKSQDTAEALEALRGSVREQPIVCAQNGVNNERLALRFFPSVYAVTIMVPAAYTVPGEVICYGVERHGICDLGRYPGGTDKVVEDVSAALGAANFAAYPTSEVMRSKHGKLLLNLGNIVEAALGRGGEAPDIIASVRAEAETVYRAAGLDWVDLGKDPRRAGLLVEAEVGGATRLGGSSTQTLARGTGHIETDYLNGEIVLMGRLNGVPTPLNAALCELGRELAASGAAPASLTADALRRRLGLA